MIVESFCYSKGHEDSIEEGEEEETVSNHDNSLYDHLNCVTER